MAERDRRLILLSYRPHRQRYREETGRKKLSERQTAGERERERCIDQGGEKR